MASACQPLERGPAPRGLLAGIERALAEWQLARSRLVLAEGVWLRQLDSSAGHHKLGYRSLTDLAREELKQTGRTARNHVHLVEVLDAWPELNEAFGSGRLGACQVLALRPLLHELAHAPERGGWIAQWIDFAEGVAVRRLIAVVRGALSAQMSPDIRSAEEADDETWQAVSFPAPMSAVLAWQEGLEITRRTLGWHAPVGDCLEAILAEAGPDDEVDSCESCEAAPRAQPCQMIPPSAGDEDTSCPDGWTSLAPGGRRKLQGALYRFNAALGQMRELAAFGLPGGAGKVPARDILSRLRALRMAHRPLRLALGEFLRALHSAYAFRRSEEESFERFVERRLKMSPRTARAMVAECRTFEDEPVLARAYVDGRLSVSHAVRLKRIVPSRHAAATELGPLIDRASRLTWRQFEREVNFLERARSMLPELRGILWPGSLPDFAAALIWRGLEIGAEGLPCCDAADVFQWDDPAEVTGHLDTLEEWLRRVIGRQEEIERQMFSRVRATQIIRFRARPAVARHWRKVCAAAWPDLPEWAAGLILMHSAVVAWQAEDRQAAVRQRRVLERDGYHCQVPGCSARRGLEVHHIVYRSSGGSNARNNLVTLCKFHHAHGIHGGRLRVRRAKRGGLYWRTPLGIWKGEIRRAAARVV